MDHLVHNLFGGPMTQDPEVCNAANDRKTIADAERVRQNPGPLVPYGTDLNIYGALPAAPMRRGLAGCTPSRRTLFNELDGMPCLRDEPDTVATFSPDGEYGARYRGDPDTRPQLIIPAGWCVEKTPEEIWRCAALILRLKFLPNYNKVYKVMDGFTATMQEGIVDGFALFLRVFSKAEGGDAELYDTFRKALHGVADDGESASLYALEAQGWLNGGFTHADESEIPHHLDERHFEHWIAHAHGWPRADLVGMLSLFDRALRGSEANRQFMTGMGMTVTPRGRELLMRLPEPWDYSALLVAEAIDRAVDRKEPDRVVNDAIEHVRYTLTATNGQEMLRRLLSPHDPFAELGALTRTAS